MYTFPLQSVQIHMEISQRWADREPRAPGKCNRVHPTNWALQPAPPRLDFHYVTEEQLVTMSTGTSACDGGSLYTPLFSQWHLLRALSAPQEFLACPFNHNVHKRNLTRVDDINLASHIQ